MTRLVRHANSKRLSPRTDGGRFATKPTLGLGVCACGRILVPRYETTGAGAVKHMPERCEDCAATEGRQDKDGLKVRMREDGVEVLDGAQKCAAFVHVHQMECEEDVVEFADGTPLDEVEELERLAKAGTPTEYVEGEWMAHRPDMDWSAATVRWAETYDAARTAAADVLDVYL